MRYFYDCEFIEDGRTIDLVSIGIVAEDGRELYAVNADLPRDKLFANPWLIDNVWPHLPLRRYDHGAGRCRCVHGHLDTDHPAVRPRTQIARAVEDFLLGPGKPVELWAYYGAYDHVTLAQLWGPMVNLPAGIPMWTNDLKQEAHQHGISELPAQKGDAHHALADAQWLHAAFLWLRAAAAADAQERGL